MWDRNSNRDPWMNEAWRVPGPYTGVGPKGYRRKDERILDEINDRLTRHGQIDASNIRAEVREGEVTLNGAVRSRREKHIAEYVAESVAGVMNVQNNLRIEREGYDAAGWSRARERAASEGRDHTMSRLEDREYIQDRYETAIPNTGTAAPQVREAPASRQDQGAVPLWGTEENPRSREVPEDLRGEGMTPPPDSDLTSGQTGSETPVYEGQQAPQTALQQDEDLMDPDEPKPVGGPAAVAAGPTDIARGASGSTLGDSMTSGDTPANTDASVGVNRPESYGEGSGETKPIFEDRDLHSKMTVNLEVLGSDLQPVGVVKEVRGNDFLVDRPMARDVYVPFTACTRVDETQVFLNIPADDVNHQGWENPPIF